MATQHFTDAELACKCGCGMLPPQDFQDRIEALRVAYGKPLRISSGARCPEHNDRVSGTGLKGPHTVAAVDFAVFGADAHRLLTCAFAMGFEGIGVQQSGAVGSRFVHVDDRRAHKGPTVWTYGR